MTEPHGNSRTVVRGAGALYLLLRRGLRAVGFRPQAWNPFRKVRKVGNLDCLVQALAARGIAYEYLLPDQITNPKLVGRSILTFHIRGVAYYFAGACLRVSDPDGVTVPGPIIDGQAARFVKRKDWVKSFLSAHGLNVPDGATFSRDAQQKAKSYFAALCPSVSYGVCVKPVSGNMGKEVHVGIQ